MFVASSSRDLGKIGRPFRVSGVRLLSLGGLDAVFSLFLFHDSIRLSV